MRAAAFDVDHITNTLAGTEGKHIGVRALLRELDITLTRLDRINHGPSAGGGGGSDEQPIPINVAAMDAATNIRRHLRKLGLAWILHRGNHITRERIATSVHRHSTTLLTPYRWTPEDVADLHDVIKRGRLIIDIPIGPDKTPGEQLAKAIEKARIAAFRDELAAGVDLARHVSAFLEEPISNGTLRLAASRGEFTPVYKFGAHTYYRVGDVLSWYSRRQALRQAA